MLGYYPNVGVRIFLIYHYYTVTTLNRFHLIPYQQLINPHSPMNPAFVWVDILLIYNQYDDGPI